MPKTPRRVGLRRLGRRPDPCWSATSFGHLATIATNKQYTIWSLDAYGVLTPECDWRRRATRNFPRLRCAGTKQHPRRCPMNLHESKSGSPFQRMSGFVETLDAANLKAHLRL